MTSEEAIQEARDRLLVKMSKILYLLLIHATSKKQDHADDLDAAVVHLDHLIKERERKRSENKWKGSPPITDEHLMGGLKPGELPE